MIRVSILGLIMLGFLFATHPVHANWLSDIRDAIAGHIDDVENRINHNDEFVEGIIINKGMFRDTDIGRDSIHWANGSVEIIENDEGKFIQLLDDFKSGHAPDLYIYIANEKVFDEISFWESRPTEISELKSGSGAQYYDVTNLEFSEVIIWCKRFGEFIGSATVK